MNFPVTLTLKDFQLYNEHLKDPKYKTEMCKNWEKYSTCPYNNKCRFAHGKEELMVKEAEANPNYRAKDCLNFFKYGYCSYGRRCCFKHDERKLNEMNLHTDIFVILKRSNPEGNSRLSVFSDLTAEMKSSNKKELLRSSTTSSEKNGSLDTTYEEIDC